MFVEIPVKTLPHFAGLELPRYQTEGSSGFDLVAAIHQDQILEPGKRALIPTGITLSIPAGHEAQIRPRSGLALKFGITLLNTPGTIDSDYRGEIQIIMVNLGDQPFTITRGMRIAQCVIASVIKAHLLPADNLDTTSRGSGGFGHTGV